MATPSSILALQSPQKRSLVGYSPWDHNEQGTTEQLRLSQTHCGDYTHQLFSVFLLNMSVFFFLAIWLALASKGASLVVQRVEDLPTVQETQVQSLGWEDPLENRMESQSSTLAWRIPWREEPSGLQSMGLQRVGHNQMTNTFTFQAVKSRSQRVGPPSAWIQDEEDTRGKDSNVSWKKIFVPETLGLFDTRRNLVRVDRQTH